MTNLFIYGSFMTGRVNHKYLKQYIPIKAVLHGYRRCWSRNKNAAILLKSPLDSVVGELYLDVTKKDLTRINRLQGIPHNYTLEVVCVTTIKEKYEFEARIFYPNADIIRKWLHIEEKDFAFHSLIIKK